MSQSRFFKPAPAQAGGQSVANRFASAKSIVNSSRPPCVNVRFRLQRPVAELSNDTPIKLETKSGETVKLVLSEIRRILAMNISPGRT